MLGTGRRGRSDAVRAMRPAKLSVLRAVRIAAREWRTKTAIGSLVTSKEYSLVTSNTVS
jgi:hypothetical protein